MIVFNPVGSNCEMDVRVRMHALRTSLLHQRGQYQLQNHNFIEIKAYPRFWGIRNIYADSAENN